MENQNVAYFFCFIFGIVFVDSIILPRLNKKILQSAKDNYKWIRREYRLLEALFKDYRGVVSSVGQIKQKASQAWDSDVAEISLQLDETQTSWLRKSGKVASDAKLQVRKYEKIMSEGDVLKKPSIVLFSLMSTLQLALEMKKAKRKIVDHFDLHQNMSVQDIYESLDISGSKVRSLQDGPIDETDHPSISSRPSFRSGAALVSILKGLIAQKPDLVRGMAEQVRSAEIQLMLLYAFMKDLRGLRLEREIQNAWVGEAQLIIIETENVTNTFFLKTSHQAWWFSVLGNWTLRRKLKRKINHVVSRIRDLLEAKERYGFKFIRRESSKFEHPHPLLQLSSNDAVISSVTGRIRDHLNRGIAQVLNNVMGLCDQLEQTQELLRNTKAIEGARNTRAACFEQLQRLASDAQISTEMHMDRHSWFSLTFVAWSSFPSEVSGIEEAVNLLQRSIRMYSIEIIEDSSSVVGLEEDIHALVSKLTNNVKNDSNIIAIVGMKGIGKTTLAKMIYNHVSIVNHFDVRRWFSLPQEINGNSLVIRNIERVLGTHEEKQEKEKRYLLVLDNLFSNKAWDVLKATFGDVGISGLKIVITTRYKAVASYANPSSIHQLRLRTKKESWEFFTQMVNVPSEVEALARKVVERTGGLPLAILHLGYLFAGKPVNSEGLSRVLERVTEGQNQTLWLDAWDINKEDLQSQPILGNCLSYFESFPIDFEIPARRLVALLVARGLVQSSNEYSNETHENVAYKYISELINRNMIQVVERKHNGKVKTCRFPSTLRELWVRRRREGGTIRSWYLVSTSLEGQLTYQFDDNDANFSRRIPGLHMNLPNFLDEERYPRSIMFFDTREGRQPGKDIGNFLHSGIKSRRFRDLLVLDLEGVFRPHLPGNIGELNQLTYLGLRWTYLETIPTSIGKLLNLQTLDVKYTYIRTLPISVWTLKKLRHLYLNEYCRIKFMPKPSAIHMKDLQTLSGVFLDGDSPLKDGLDKVNNLRKLGLAFQLTLPQQEVLAKLILQLTHLQSLSLSSVNEKSEPQDLKLEPLSGLQKLSSLYLFGKLERPCITSELPESLTELTLSASRLPEDPMLNLGKLPKLKSLSFFSDSYEGTCMLCLSQSFPQLLVLKLWSLNYLLSLCVEEGAMPNVREMEIRSCKKLKVTTGLTHLKTLQELKLTNMPKEYAADVRNGFAVAMEQCRRQIIHYPRIKIDNY